MMKGNAESEEEESSLSSELLPDDIMIHDILTRLPVKSILRFRCVRKSWLKLFRSPNFIKNHYNHGVKNEKFKLILLGHNYIYSSLDYFDPSLTCCEISENDYPFNEDDETLIWGECNGLLCIASLNEERICVWNTSTKEYKLIPLPEEEVLEAAASLGCGFGAPHSLAYGFGYDSNIDDYKVVRIFNFFDNNNRESCEIKIYTFGSNSWKHIPVIYPYVISCRWVVINGILHGVGESHDSDVIVSLDFGVEMFVEMPKPEHLEIKSMGLSVGDLGGCLCIFDVNRHKDVEVGFVVWVMKEYGVRESWTKLFTIVQQSLFRPRYELIQSFAIGELLIYIHSLDPNNDGDSKDFLSLCDPKNERGRALNICVEDGADARGFYLSQTKTYVESLVSLNTGTYVQKRVPKTMESEEAYGKEEEKKEKDEVGEGRVAEPKEIESDKAYE